MPGIFEWWPVLLGWPAVIVSLICAALGIAFRKTVWFTVGAVLALPFAGYLSLTPLFQFVGPVIALLYFVAAYALAKGRRGLALALLVPFLTVVAWLGYHVLNRWL